MELRIKKTLGNWAILEVKNYSSKKNSLFHVLENLLGQPPNEEHLDYYLELRHNYEDDFRDILKEGIASGEIIEEHPDTMVVR